MLNSANYSLSAKDDKGVHLNLNSGESISPDVDYKDPDTKIYYHQVPGAITHMPDGAQIQFLGGQFATKNPDVKAFLDKIVDRRGSMVFSKKTVAVTHDLAVAATDASKPAGDAGLVLEGKIPEATPEMTAKTAVVDSKEGIQGLPAAAPVVTIKR